MFTRIVAAGVVFLFAIGCSKKPAKPTGASDDTATRPPAQASTPEKPKTDAKAKKDEKPNWLNDPRYNGKGEDGVLPKDAPIGGKPGLGVALPPVASGNPLVAGGTTLPGAVGNPPVNQPPLNQPLANPAPPPATGTSGKAVTKADMNEVWIFIENRSLATGQMPRPETVYAALVQTNATAAGLVKSNDIILTGATTRESVWAYERNAPTQGGWIATQNGPEQVTAKEFAQRLGR
jgi:hypothetical protein